MINFKRRADKEKTLEEIVIGIEKDIRFQIAFLDTDCNGKRPCSGWAVYDYDNRTKEGFADFYDDAYSAIKAAQVELMFDLKENDHRYDSKDINKRSLKVVYAIYNFPNKRRPEIGYKDRNGVIHNMIVAIPYIPQREVIDIKKVKSLSKKSS